MSFLSAFEILGPIMIGPSSSHTAGAARLAQLARSLVEGEIVDVEFVLYNSFASTYEGHGTDRALLAGIMGHGPDDPSIRDAFRIADERGLSYRFTPSDHGEGLAPNSVDMNITTDAGHSMSIHGESMGGGQVVISRIDGVDVDMAGDYNSLFVIHRDVPGVLGALASTLGEHDVNIAFMRSYRTTRGEKAYTIFETDEIPSAESIEEIRSVANVLQATAVEVPGSTPVLPGITVDVNFTSGNQLLERCQEFDLSIGALMRRREEQLTDTEITAQRMKRVLEVMREETMAPIYDPQRSMGGLIGGEAQAVFMSRGTDLEIAGEAITRAISYAMATLERSATMGLIVASPTAGASGVVPGAILGVADTRDIEDDIIIQALFTCCAVGYLIATNAFVSGARGGCQAETGSASAMAAAGLVEMLGGTPEQALHAASLALANMLGLVCDPIRGLVESPCQTRNAGAATNAITSAQLALAGVTSVVPFDEVVQAMYDVGRAMPSTLRETAKGGLAVAPSVCQGCSLD